MARRRKYKLGDIDRGTSESHKCPACDAKTTRRIRYMPTLGTTDARCHTCVKKGRWPEQEKHYERPVLQGGTEATQAKKAVKENKDQASLLEGGGEERDT